MKKCVYIMTVIVMAMFAVSCNDKITDPFLGNVVIPEKKENETNFETFVNTLQNSSYYRAHYLYEYIDNKWKFYDSIDGAGGSVFFMTDSKTLIGINLYDAMPDKVACEKYSISFNPTTATITTVKILPDGTAGETYHSTLLASNPIVVIEGSFAGMIVRQYINSTELSEVPVRWCFEEFEREVAMKLYEKWLSEQE